MATINEKISKDIKYIGKDFPTIRKNLVEFAKTYYPTTFNDFNEALLPYATERKNINALAQSLGYNPKQAIAAQVEVDIFQTIPAVGTGESNKPDFRYALAVKVVG